MPTHLPKIRVSLGLGLHGPEQGFRCWREAWLPRCAKMRHRKMNNQSWGTVMRGEHLMWDVARGRSLPFFSFALQ